MQIYLSGPDVAGKNSLMHGLAKELEYKPFMSPRSPICNIVYDNLYRNTECFIQNMDLVSKLLKLGAIFILVLVKPEILVKRAKERNEKHVSQKSDFVKHIREYKRVFNICKENNNGFGHRFIVINNNTSLSKAVKKLKKLIDVSKKHDHWIANE
jgi:thymidylate kinase